MHGERVTLPLARISEHFQAAIRTSWRFKWRYAEEWFAENKTVVGLQKYAETKLISQVPVDGGQITSKLQLLLYESAMGFAGGDRLPVRPPVVGVGGI